MSPTAAQVNANSLDSDALGIAVKTYPPLAEIGTSGIAIFAGRVMDEWEPQLVGDQAPRMWRMMADVDPVVGSFLFGTDQQVRGTKWSVEPAEGDKSTEWADFVWNALNDMEEPWAEALSAIMSQLTYGWSFLETVIKKRRGMDVPDSVASSKYNDNRVGWRKWPLRVQETRWRWGLGPHNEIEYLVQTAPPVYIPEPIPVSRGLLFRTTAARGSPEGRSVLRNSYDAWYKKSRLERLELIGAERDLAGLPVISVPPVILSDQATAEQISIREALLELVTKIRRDEKEGFLFPLEYDQQNNQTYKIELLASPGQRQFNTDTLIGRYDQRIAMPMLADFILLGHEQVGSYNLGSAKIDLFTAALQAWVEGIAGIVNSKAIPRLMAANGMPRARSPRLVPGKIAKPDLAGMGTFLQAIAGAGAPLFPNETLQKALLRMGGLPDDLPPEKANPAIMAHLAAAQAGKVPLAIDPDKPPTGKITPSASLSDPDDVPDEFKPATKAAGDAAPHTGAMVALYPSPAVAAKLAVKGGEPANELHVTLAFLGDATDIANPDALAQAIATFASTATPLVGEVAGMGRFNGGANPGGDGANHAVYASIDCPALASFRQRLVAAIEAGGVEPSKVHGFTPHMTLQYLDPGKPTPEILPGPEPLEFDTVWLVLGGKRQGFKLSGHAEAKAA